MNKEHWKNKLNFAMSYVFFLIIISNISRFQIVEKLS